MFNTPCLRVFYLFFIVATTLPQSHAKDQPNILFIIADDLGWGDVSYHNKEVITPNLNRLRKQGTTLTRHYSTPVCSTTRGAILTGRNPIVTGVFNYSPLPVKEILLPQLLKQSGYQTWLTGKWHLAATTTAEEYPKQYMPNARGFDHFYGHGGAGIDFYTHTPRHKSQPDWLRNSKTIHEKGYTTDLITNEAISLIKNRESDKPFYLQVAYNAVHSPIHTPPGGTAMYKHINNLNRQKLLATATYMDACIGKLLDTIEQQNIAKSTMIIFISDNGGATKQGAQNLPLKGSKTQVFEGGVRVPAIVSWPGKISTEKDLAHFIWAGDWFPTICEATQTNIPHSNTLHGVSAWKNILSGKNTQRASFIVGHRDTAVIQHPYKLITLKRENQSYLYHIENDPFEQKDISSTNPEIVKSLSAELEKMLQNKAQTTSSPRGSSSKRGSSGRDGTGAERPNKNNSTKKGLLDF